MADIEKTLRHEARYLSIAESCGDECGVEYGKMCLDAADEIERLRKALGETRAVIIGLRPPQRGDACWCWYSHDIERCGHQIQCVNARAALEDKRGEQ